MTGWPVRTENSMTPNRPPRVRLATVTIFVPSGVMIELPIGPVLAWPWPTKLTAGLVARRLPPGAVVSSRRTCVMPPDWVQNWKARICPSAVQESGWPPGLALPTQVPPEGVVPGQAQRREDPVASVTILISAVCWARASLLPSGDTPMPPSCSAGGPATRDNRVSCAVRVRGSNRSRKNTTGVVLSRCCATAPSVPDVTFHQRWAARTNVRSSAAPLTNVNEP